MNDPKQVGAQSAASQPSHSTEDRQLETLVTPVREDCIAGLRHEVTNLTLDSFNEVVTRTSRLLTTHRLTSEFLSSTLPSRHAGILPPLPAEQFGGLVVLRPLPERKLIVLGDIHGDLESLFSILTQSKCIERIKAGEDLYLLGLGDYINKGPHALESIYVLFRLLVDPNLQGRVILLRGNHEDRHGTKEKEETRLRKKFFASMKEHPISKNAQATAFQKAVTIVSQSFDELPHSLYSSCGLFASHSGYSQWVHNHNRKKGWETLREWPPNQQLMRELLDSNITQKSSAKEPKKAEGLLALDIYRFMEKLEVTLLLRGHQTAAPKTLDPNETWRSGYWYLSQSHPSGNKGVVTLNSSRYGGPRHSGPALPAYAEVSLSRAQIGLEDCTLYTLRSI